MGDVGTILTSTNGLQWTTIPSPATNLLFSVAFANGKFVAVGGDDTGGHEKGILFSSTDGVQWEEKPVNAPYLLTGIASGPDVAVAVGYRGSVLTSTDLDEWHLRSTDVTKIGLRDVIWAKSRFFAVGGFSDLQSRFHYVILDSPDGKHWNQVTRGDDAQLSSICEGNGLLVAVGTASQSDNGEVILTSADGITWSRRDLDPNSNLSFVAFGNGRFVASGDARTLYSSNGTNWTAEANGPSYATYLGSVGGKFFASNRNGNPFGLEISNDGINWRSAGLLETVTANPVFGVAWFNGQFIATVGDVAVYLSTNGTVWRKASATVTPTVPPIGEGSLHDSLVSLAYAEGQLVATGTFLVDTPFGLEDLGAIYTSVDGTNWVRRFNLSNSGFSKVAFGAGTFVAVGGPGAILQSGVLPLTPAAMDRITVSGFSGSATLNISGPVGRNCRIEYTDSVSDPSAWMPLKTISISDSPFAISDDSIAGQSRRFYRTVTLP